MRCDVDIFGFSFVFQCQLPRHRGPKERVLVTAPSNAAVDLLVSRLLRRGVPPSFLFRLQAYTRDAASIPDDVKKVSGSTYEGDKNGARVVAMTLMTASRYARVGDVHRGEPFTLAIVDEAGNATEPETLGAFADIPWRYGALEKKHHPCFWCRRSNDSIDTK